MNQVAVMASALGSIALIATPDGKIRPAKFADDKIVVGEPVDIIASGTIIISAIKQFTSLITKEFKDISLKDIVRAMFAMKAIGVMLDPISNFTNALMSFDSSDGTTLHTVKRKDILSTTFFTNRVKKCFLLFFLLHILFKLLISHNNYSTIS